MKGRRTIRIITGAGLCLFWLCSGLSAQSPSITVGPKSEAAASALDIRKAKRELRAASTHYQKIGQLAKSGSASKLQLQRARRDKEVAEFELDSLQQPENRAGNQVEIARLNFEFEQNNLAAATQLSKTGSISRLQLRRTSFRFKIAEAELKAATGEISSEAARLVIARQHVDLAQSEWELGQKLYQRRSISQSSFQRLTDRRDEAREQLHDLEAKQRRKQEAIKQKVRT